MRVDNTNDTKKNGLIILLILIIIIRLQYLLLHCSIRFACVSWAITRLGYCIRSCGWIVSIITRRLHAYPVAVTVPRYLPPWGRALLDWILRVDNTSDNNNKPAHLVSSPVPICLCPWAGTRLGHKVRASSSGFLAATEVVRWVNYDRCS